MYKGPVAGGSLVGGWEDEVPPPATCKQPLFLLPQARTDCGQLMGGPWGSQDTPVLGPPSTQTVFTNSGLLTAAPDSKYKQQRRSRGRTLPGLLGKLRSEKASSLPETARPSAQSRVRRGGAVPWRGQACATREEGRTQLFPGPVLGLRGFQGPMSEGGLLPPGEEGQPGLQTSQCWARPLNHTVTTLTAERAGGLRGPAVSDTDPSRRFPSRGLDPAGPSRLGPSGFQRAGTCSGAAGGWWLRAPEHQDGATAAGGGGLQGRDTGSSPLGLPGNYVLGANINKGSRNGVLIPDLTSRLLHMREIAGPRTVSIPRPSSLSNLLLLLILTGFSQAGGGGKQGEEGAGRRGAQQFGRDFGQDGNMLAHSPPLP